MVNDLLNISPKERETRFGGEGEERGGQRVKGKEKGLHEFLSI